MIYIYSPTVTVHDWCLHWARLAKDLFNDPKVEIHKYEAT